MIKKPNKEYFHLFLTVAACILFYFLLVHFSQVSAILQKVMKVVNPVLYGFVIAYLLNPIMKLFSRLFVKIRKKEKETRGIRIASLIFTYIVALLIVSAVVLIVVPQTVNSVTALATNFKTYVTNFSQWLGEKTAQAEALPGGSIVQQGLEGVTSYLQNFVSGFADTLVDLLPNVITFLTGLTTTLGSLLFGMFLSIYMLFDKENLIARVKKTTYTLFRQGTAKRIILFFRETNETVGNFINGKILDSFIIAILTYLVFLIAGIPYASLLAVVVGITNIIPMFGPIIGAVLDGLLVLLISPKHLILFIILIVIIQQIDGNVIGPKIIGKATGLSGFWVMVALTLGGGFFGVPGMILAVPVFTVLYRGFSKLVNVSLKNSGLPDETSYYVDFPPREVSTEEREEKKAFFLVAFFRKIFSKKKKKKSSEPENTEQSGPASSEQENGKQEAPAFSEQGDEKEHGTL